MRLLASLCLVLGPIFVRGQFTAFDAPVVDAPGTESEAAPAPARNQGAFFIESITAFPAPGEADSITIKNYGSGTGNLTGFRLSDSATTSGYVFGRAGCERQAIVRSGDSVRVSASGPNNTCGFSFSLGIADEVHLFDPQGRDISNFEWNVSRQGYSFYRDPAGEYIELPYTGSVIDVLRASGQFNIFLDLLDAAGYSANLSRPTDANFTQCPVDSVASQSSPFLFLSLPWWFQGGTAPGVVARPVEVPVSQVECTRFNSTRPGIPRSGPYTILAPTDEAMNNALRTLVGASAGEDLNISPTDLLNIPGFTRILEYHILPGLYNSSYLRNDTALNTAAVTDVYIARDAGNILFDDSCIDRPTLDPFTCNQQKQYNQCYMPFMTTAADWPGGYCERTCQRCSCDDGSCSQIVLSNLRANNGIVFGISRILFPARNFTKSFAPAPEQLRDSQTVLGGPRGGGADLPSLSALLPSAAAPPVTAQSSLLP